MINNIRLVTSILQWEASNIETDCMDGVSCFDLFFSNDDAILGLVDVIGLSVILPMQMTPPVHINELVYL